MRPTKDNCKKWLRKLLRFLWNPRFLLCFCLAWMITNGWSYILFVIGSYFHISWMIGISGAYLAFLWLPISPEKPITLSLAVLLLKGLFPKDEKTLGVLLEIYADIKQRIIQKRKHRRADKRPLAHRKTETGEG